MVVVAVLGACNAATPTTTAPAELPEGLEPHLSATSRVLNEFWSELLSIEGLAYTSPAVAPYRSGEVASTECNQGSEAADWVDNAFYCFIDGTVVYDLDFLGRIFTERGPDPAAGVIAHEWGHHLQSIRGRPQHSLQRELQADCLAGTFLANLNVDRTNIEPALNAMESFLDAGNRDYRQSTWFDVNEHGSPVLRWSALVLGSLGVGDLTMCDGYSDYEPSAPVHLGEYSIAHLPGYEYRVAGDTMTLGRDLVEVEIRLLSDRRTGSGAFDAGEQTWESYFDGVEMVGRFPGEPAVVNTPLGEWASWSYHGIRPDGKIVVGFWRIFDPAEGSSVLVDGRIVDPPVTEPIDTAEYLLLSRASVATYGVENFMCVPGQSADRNHPAYSFSCALEE